MAYPFNLLYINLLYIKTCSFLFLHFFDGSPRDIEPVNRHDIEPRQSWIMNHHDPSNSHDPRNRHDAGNRHEA